MIDKLANLIIFGFVIMLYASLIILFYQAAVGVFT